MDYVQYLQQTPYPFAINPSVILAPHHAAMSRWSISLLNSGFFFTGFKFSGIHRMAQDREEELIWLPRVPILCVTCLTQEERRVKAKTEIVIECWGLGLESHKLRFISCRRGSFSIIKCESTIRVPRPWNVASGRVTCVWGEKHIYWFVNRFSPLGRASLSGFLLMRGAQVDLRKGALLSRIVSAWW